MELHFSKKSEGFGQNIFSTLNEIKNRRLAEGRPVYNLSVGTPDFPPAPHVMEALSQAALDPENYKYSLCELPELIAAARRWYKRRYQVELADDEVMSLYGTQEGMAHIAMTLCDPGDVILAPNPCYPIFEVGPALCDARVEYYRLDEAKGYLPDLEGIPEEVARAAKAIVVSFPSNPVCATVPDSFYPRLIEFAKRHSLIVLHDNAYSEIVFDGASAGSFLAFEGAREVGVEFNSLSKSYNLTGMRISFMVGNREIVKRFKDTRSQIDYGIFYPVQKAAIAALDGPQDSVRKGCAEYERRRDALCGGLRSVGWQVPDSKGTMFAWAPLPKGYTNSLEFCMELLDKTGVICTPGSSFGSLGEGHVRFALVLPVPVIQELVEVIGGSGIIK